MHKNIKRCTVSTYNVGRNLRPMRDFSLQWSAKKGLSFLMLSKQLSKPLKMKQDYGLTSQCHAPKTKAFSFSSLKRNGVSIKYIGEKVQQRLHRPKFWSHCNSEASWQKLCTIHLLWCNCLHVLHHKKKPSISPWWCIWLAIQWGLSAWMHWVSRLFVFAWWPQRHPPRWDIAPHGPSTHKASW